MNVTYIFLAVAAVTLLSASGAAAIALTGRGDRSRMTVASRLAHVALIGAAALAGLLNSPAGQ